MSCAASPGAKIRDCVLTVPVYFTQAERVALMDAAELAGLKVLSLVEDNTAAAIQCVGAQCAPSVVHVVAGCVGHSSA